MTKVYLTPHLCTFFPQLQGRTLEVPGTTAREVVEQLEAIAPGIGLYLCDERGCLRRHVNLFIGTQMVRDRKGLSDLVAADGEVHILQALSGG